MIFRELAAPRAQQEVVVAWDKDELASGNPEAQAALDEAARIFRVARERGLRCLRVVPGGSQIMFIEEFDQQAEVIVMIPAVVGG